MIYIDEKDEDEELYLSYNLDSKKNNNINSLNKKNDNLINALSDTDNKSKCSCFCFCCR